MTRTTPPRPLDVTRLFPELREHSATATRLHPRPGSPTAADSSVGGPLLWPADEAWPVCTDGDGHDAFQLQTPATVRRRREIFAAAQARAAETGSPYALADAERAQLPDVVHPEQIREYQYGGLLPGDLGARIAAWEDQVERESGGGARVRYQFDLSLAPGWKVGGFANWSLTDPQPMTCSACGAAMTLLLTAASSEWHGSGGSWRPGEEPAGAPSTPTDVTIGRGYALHVFRCPVSFDHPPATAMQ